MPHQPPTALLCPRLRWLAQVDLSLVQAQDAADAEAVLTQLMRTAADVEVTTDSEVTAATFFEEIHRLLADFNVALQEESKDRKYRFVVKRLMKANQRQGDEVDEELDYYRKHANPTQDPTPHETPHPTGPHTPHHAFVR